MLVRKTTLTEKHGTLNKQVVIVSLNGRHTFKTKCKDIVCSCYWCKADVLFKGSIIRLGEKQTSSDCHEQMAYVGLRGLWNMV